MSFTAYTFRLHSLPPSLCQPPVSPHTHCPTRHALAVVSSDPTAQFTNSLNLHAATCKPHASSSSPALPGNITGSPSCQPLNIILLCDSWAEPDIDSHSTSCIGNLICPRDLTTNAQKSLGHCLSNTGLGISKSE